MAVRAFVYIKSERSVRSNRCNIVADEARREGVRVLWVKCNTCKDFLAFIHELLVSGIFPRAVGSLDGNVRKIEELNLERIEEFLNKSLMLNDELVVEYTGSDPSRLAELLKIPSVKAVKLFPKSPRKAYVSINGTLNAYELFDLGFKVLKPAKIPP